MYAGKCMVSADCCTNKTDIAIFIDAFVERTVKFVYRAHFFVRNVGMFAANEQKHAVGTHKHEISNNLRQNLSFPSICVLVILVMVSRWASNILSSSSTCSSCNL